MNSPKSQYILGVTGSMGCGKTTVCRRIKEFANSKQIPTLRYNYNTLRKAVFEQTDNQIYQIAQEEIKSLVTENISAENEGIDKHKLTQISYLDGELLTTVDRIVESAIMKTVENNSCSHQGLVLFESAFLTENKQLDLVKGNVLLVTCSYTEQLRRLDTGDLPFTQIKRQIALQYPNSIKILVIQKYQH